MKRATGKLFKKFCVAASFIAYMSEYYSKKDAQLFDQFIIDLLLGETLTSIKTTYTL